MVHFIKASNKMAYIAEVDGRDEYFDSKKNQESLLLDDQVVVNFEGKWKKMSSVEEIKRIISTYLNNDEKIPLNDYARFEWKIWGIPNGNLDETSKYYNPVYVSLSDDQETEINNLLLSKIDGWTLEQLTESLKILLPQHRKFLDSSEYLYLYVIKHSGNIINRRSPDFDGFQELLNEVDVSMPLVVFRTLNTDYRTKLNVGETYVTEDIWSTSYYPLSSFAFGISEEKDISTIYVLRARINPGFTGGLIIEDNLQTIKNQHEMTIAAGKEFKVNSIKIYPMKITDSLGMSKRFRAKVYDLEFL